ncbi:META domain-containing protein [Halomonas garicola]|uniref:META domain-containing protein n=1 Tax=Halomonas garicola TaxID=1690008 RepID=UPI0028A1AB55|nr:META domain-containing protein [Halomonas garicola]
MTPPVSKPSFFTRRWSAAGALAAAVTLLAACSSTPPASTPDEAGGGKPLSGEVVDQRWNLLLIGTHERLDLPESAHFRIAPDGRISGSDGCNRFTGKASLGDKQRISIEELATTRKACPQLDDAKRVTDMLENAYRYLIDHDRLVFFGPDSRVIGGWRKAN